MSLWQMSFSGAILIIIVVCIRAVFLNRLPKRTFLILWGIVFFRLLIPCPAPAAWSVYSAAESFVSNPYGDAGNASAENGGGTAQGESAGISVGMVQGQQVGSGVNMAQGEQTGSGVSMMQRQQSGQTGGSDGTSQGESAGSSVDMAQGEQTASGASMAQRLQSNLGSVWQWIVGVFRKPFWSPLWAAGMAVCAGFFLMAYLRCRAEFLTSLPVDNDFVREWLETHPLRRTVAVRQSDRIQTPLTYGVVRPVILMPKKTDWDNGEQLECVFLHEYVHICRFDSMAKLICTAVLCVHWFNPLVWVMYFLFNRDIELACDEGVVRRMGEGLKQRYAQTLIGMEEVKSGLLSFYNSFSKNSTEERIVAIMKTKKISRYMAIAAAVIILMVSTCAVAAAPARRTDAAEKEKTADVKNAADGAENDAVTGDDSSKKASSAGLTDEELEMLLALQFPGYEDMTVSEFQQKVWELTDTVEYMDMLEHISQNETFYAQRDEDETAAFYYYVLEPIAAWRWRTRDFSGYVLGEILSSGDVRARGGSVWKEPAQDLQNDSVMLEYVLTLDVLQADVLTVGEYKEARQDFVEELCAWFEGQTSEDMQSGDFFARAEKETEWLCERLSSENLWVWAETSASGKGAAENDAPGTRTAGEDMENALLEEEKILRNRIEAEIMAQWEQILEPYLPFGLSFEKDDTEEYDIKMFYQGHEVKSIYDSQKGIWITEHAGNSTFAEDAVELYAVYNASRELSGLRIATEREKEMWDEVRKPEYTSLLVLKENNYKDKKVADFDDALLTWANEDYDRHQRVMEEIIDGAYEEKLTEEEQEFMQSVLLSNWENAAYVTSLQKEEPEKDVCLSGRLTKESDDWLAWCDLDYEFSYHITDKARLTVGVRDEKVFGMEKGIEAFWEQTGLDELLQMTEEDVREELQKIARKYSGGGVTIRVERVKYESMDERDFLSY